MRTFKLFISFLLCLAVSYVFGATIITPDNFNTLSKTVSSSYAQEIEKNPADVIKLGNTTAYSGYAIVGIEQTEIAWSNYAYYITFEYTLLPVDKLDDVEYICSDTEYAVSDEIEGKRIIAKSSCFAYPYTPTAMSGGRQYDVWYYFDSSLDYIIVKNDIINTTSDNQPSTRDNKPSNAYYYKYCVAKEKSTNTISLVNNGIYYLKNSSVYGVEYLYEQNNLLYSTTTTDLSSAYSKWRIIKNDDGYYIQNIATERYISSTCGGQSGAGLSQMTTQETPEKFYFTEQTEGSSLYCIQSNSMQSAGLYLNAAGWGSPVGTYSQQSDDTSGWEFVETDVRVQNNEIWYTSSDGNVVTPYYSNGFGVTIISNTYENGKGIIKFNGDVTCIGYSAFYKCSKLTSVTIPNSVTSIDDFAFSYCSILASINIPEKVTRIGSYAFRDCSSLTSIMIPNSVNYIGNLAFFNCYGLTSINFPNSITDINYGAFWNCGGFTSITLPYSLKSLGRQAFENCQALTSVTINSATSIEDYAFDCCYSLSNVYCYAKTTPTTASNAFTGTPSTKTLHVHKCALSAYQSTAPWSAFSSIEELPYNVISTDLSNQMDDEYLQEGDQLSLQDDLKSLSVTETIPNINLTYTRNFSDATVGNWQAWYMPCNFEYKDLSEDFDVAEIAGVLVDKNGTSYVAFRKISEGIVKAHTPYVIRAKEAGETFVTTTTTLLPTAEAKSFSIKSAISNFTFGGVYANSYLSAEYPSYAMSKSGNFAMMGTSVYLRPFRIYMRITDREDNPYASSDPIFEVKVVVFGDDETSIDEIHNSQFIMHNDNSSEIYNLGGQKLQKLQKGINIVNGKKVMY